MTAVEWLQVETLDLDGQGVAHNARGKVVFVEGALPGETVRLNVNRRKDSFERGVVTEVAKESPSRVKPPCGHFGLHPGACGGCRLQHLEPTAQVAVKQLALESTLWHVGRVKAERMLRPIEGLSAGYRDRARLSVRYVVKKGEVLVGFHERKSTYIADIRSCVVLAPKVSSLLVPLRRLIESLTIRDRVPQIEVALGASTVALVLRHLEPVGADDRARLRAFAAEHGVQWWLQPDGPDSVRLLDPPGTLSYPLAEHGVTMHFLPTDFTQVNHAVNQVLVKRALQLLEVEPHHSVIDWFCGLGNFTLPIATLAARVLGVEGSQTLVGRAIDNARANGLQTRATFESLNLFEVTTERLLAWPRAHRWLIDPPREGAIALVKALSGAVVPSSPEGTEPNDEPFSPPERIVYVSCNPATLARDASVLVHQAGYELKAAGVVNMFAHTAHVESVALFVRACS